MFRLMSDGWVKNVVKFGLVAEVNALLKPPSALRDPQLSARVAQLMRPS